MEHEREGKITSLAFSDVVASRLGGETITLCYQCGTCASSCPVAKITPRFNPRVVLKLSLIGERDEVISGDAIWLCCSCYNCDERCPQQVAVAEVMYALRNVAFEEGYIPSIYSQFASAILNDGRVVKVSKFVERKRPTLGLPPLQPTGVDALRKILSATGFDKLQQKKERES